MSDKNSPKEPLVRICSTPKSKRMKPRRLTMPSKLRTPKWNNVDEIVKRYSMQLEAKPEEKLSEECLEEINTLEKTFQELDDFELQMESVKNSPIDIDENKNNDEAKDVVMKETKIGKKVNKGRKMIHTKNVQTPILKENNNEHSHRRSIRHLLT
ncbi:hypothetical protein Mgra_00006411 [Meloidogyne graminicola]|uniref:Uncharacterized protein n=1 Tax=Meloidogyne graminicola TaxID=189291 RepID=A0A8S9ZLS0_9BILA|nr:hypothetical protein Mgra_00006411 [Meloidogyne graminicola]